MYQYLGMIGVLVGKFYPTQNRLVVYYKELVVLEHGIGRIDANQHYEP